MSPPEKLCLSCQFWLRALPSDMDSKLGKKNISQAVVLADAFATTLTPMRDVFLPSVLLPVLNVPLLEYLLETLRRSGIRELFLYCNNPVDSLRTYLSRNPSKEPSVSLIVSHGCRSLGDALRDLDTKGLIRGHFILIRGDAFLNVDLPGAFNFHLAKSEKDKSTAMTMLFRSVGSTRNSFLREETSLLVVNKVDDKILFCKKLPRDEKKICLELNWFLDHGRVEISSDCLDARVYLCSPSVLPLFADNFDFQTMEDFVKGVLMNQEILNASVYCRKLPPDDYCLPLSSWRTYYALSRDLLHRRGYPLAPGVFEPLRDFVFVPPGSYKHRSVKPAKGCVLGKNSLIGEYSFLDEGTLVTDSVIGERCKIGRRTTLVNSIVFSNVTIGDDCKIVDALVFPNCRIGENTELRGTVFSPDAIVPAGERYVDSVLEARDNNFLLRTIADLAIDPRLLFFQSTDDATALEPDRSSCTDESSSATDQSSRQNSPLPDDTNMFLTEVIDSLLRGFQDKLNCENLILEINSSRYAYNVTMREVTYNVVKAILCLPLHYLSEIKDSIDPRNYKQNLKIMIDYFQPIIFNYVKTETAQEDCLRAMEEVAGTTDQFLPFLQSLLHLFYNRNVLSEEKILEWYESTDETDEITAKNVRDAVRPLIRWLQEDDEEDSSESD